MRTPTSPAEALKNSLGATSAFKMKTPVADPKGSATGVGWKCSPAALEIEQDADANDAIASSGVARI